MRIDKDKKIISIAKKDKLHHIMSHYFDLADIIDEEGLDINFEKKYDLQELLSLLITMVEDDKYVVIEYINQYADLIKNAREAEKEK